MDACGETCNRDTRCAISRYLKRTCLFFCRILMGVQSIVFFTCRWEIQFKGAGLTPYSRTADGRKVSDVE